MRPTLDNLKLNHIGILSPDPQALAAWYSDHFGLMQTGSFAYGDGWLLACGKGNPSGDPRTHFGFTLPSKARVKSWGDYFSARDIAFEVQRDGRAIFVKDPAGNHFEMYYDPTVFVPPE